METIWLAYKLLTHFLPAFSWAHTDTSGILQIQKSDIPRIMVLFVDLLNSTCKYHYKLWEVPPFLPPRNSHRDSHCYGAKKLRHIACPLRVLKSGISKISKKWQNLEDLTIQVLFSDLQKSIIKGTVARDFRPPLFSIKRTYLGPWYIS
jgi:hypothetical protein